MTIRLPYRQTLSAELIIVQTCRNDIEDFGKHSNLLNLQVIMGRDKIEITILRIVKNFGTKHTVLTVEIGNKTIQNLIVVNPIERYSYMTNSKFVLKPNHDTSIITDRTFTYPFVVNLVENRQLNDQTTKYKRMGNSLNHINQINNGVEPTFF